CFRLGLGEKGNRPAPRICARMILAGVRDNNRPVPSKNFISEPVRESRPSGNQTRRPPWSRYSVIRFTAKGEFKSTGKVRRARSRRKIQPPARGLGTTNRQSSSRQTATSSQSHQDT